MKLALWQTVIATALVSLAASASAQSLRESLKDIPVASHWIYDDLPQAIAQAKQTHKPLLVVLRCVPCPPGRTLDEQVMQPDDDLAKLEQQFVCVRVIQTNGLDYEVPTCTSRTAGNRRHGMFALVSFAALNPASANKH